MHKVLASCSHYAEIKHIEREKDVNSDLLFQFIGLTSFAVIVWNNVKCVCVLNENIDRMFKLVYFIVLNMNVNGIGNR